MISPICTKCVLVISVFFVLFDGASTGAILDVTNNRTGKFWGVGVVRFENGICHATDGLVGTCYTRRQCRRSDGVGSASCASGIGVCCIIQRTCGESSSLNNTYFVSPGFPNTFTDSSSCTLTIQRCNSDICQVRIDFLTLNLAQPDANGTCVTDALYVIGGASAVPVICGENSGQHIYVDFNGDTPIQIVIATGALATLGRSWNIKVAQIGCDCPWRAPSGCLQFHTALSGTIKSFNYGTATGLASTRQLVNENYGVCIDMQAGYCGIQYSAGTGQYSFTVSNDTNSAISQGTIGTIDGEVFGANCTTDFVVIPHPVLSNGTALDTDRFCGNGFATVYTQSKPFVLTVVTNGNEVNETSNRGFCLNYKQLRCAGINLG